MPDQAILIRGYVEARAPFLRLQKHAFGHMKLL